MNKLILARSFTLVLYKVVMYNVEKFTLGLRKEPHFGSPPTPPHHPHHTTQITHLLCIIHEDNFEDTTDTLTPLLLAQDTTDRY